MRPFYIQTYHKVVFILCFVLGCNVQLNGQCDQIINRARKDVGYTEGGTGHNNNKGKLLDYYRSNVAKSLNSWSAPYCGCSVQTWFLEAGLKPKNSNPAVAKAWIRPNSIPLGVKATQANIKKIKPGYVIVMQFNGRNYHVGVAEAATITYLVNIEGNTSDPSDKKRKWKREGVFRKIRPYHTLLYASDWCSDATPVDSTKYLKLRISTTK